MFAKIKSAFPTIEDTYLVDIEVDIGKGLHAFHIVGLGDKAINEARERVSGALKNSGFVSPKTQNQKITIALSPASLKKEGVYFDLAIAVGYMIASKQLSYNPKKALFCGELSLDGGLKKVRGVSAVISKAYESGIHEVYIPHENILEGNLFAEKIFVYPVKTLRELYFHLIKSTRIKPLTKGAEFPIKNNASTEPNKDETFLIDEIKNNAHAKRLLEIGLAGKHHMAFWGPAGVGKTMLAHAAQELVPKLTQQEIIDFAKHNLEYEVEKRGCTMVPFRSPHHSISYAALIGNAKQIGEITKAHKGILVLDELAEFDTRSLESLRQPLEEKVIRISRSEKNYELPCDFILIATMNPCPCGKQGSKVSTCTCALKNILKYKRKISEPLISRIPLWANIDLHGHSAEHNDSKDGYKTGRELKTNIMRVRKEMDKSGSIVIPFTQTAQALLASVQKRLLLSQRSISNIKKVSTTIACIDNKKQIDEECILESLQYRYTP